MWRIKSVVFLLMILTLGAFAKCKTKQLVCISATAQPFIGGAAGSPSGTNYHLSFIANANAQKLKLDRFWLGNEYFEVSAMRVHGANSSPEFSANDTISVMFTKLNTSTMEFNNQQEPQSKLELPKPYDFKGEGLLGFTLGKQRKYLQIEKFEKLKRQNYQ